MSQLYELSAVDQIEEVKNRSVTAVELLKSHLSRISQIEPKIKAWVHLDFDSARRQARVIDEQISAGNFRGSLFGVPVGIKDVFNTFDMPTQMGSSLWKGFQPGNDARVVDRLRLEGTVFPGKTVTAEFGVHTPGPTHNPHRHGYMPGTSSSGSAAAVASLMVPLAMGTQTAGSTLRPASYCGLFGYKSSFGLLPRTGMLKTTDTLDHVGLLARSLNDIILIFETLRVSGENYPLVHKFVEKRQPAESRKWRVAFIEHPKWEFAETYAKDAIEKFVKRMSRKTRWQITRTKLPPETNTVHQIHERIYDKCLWYYFQKEAQSPDRLSRVFKEMIDRGRKITLEEYRQDIRQQEIIAQKLDDWFKDFDVVITLTTGGEAMKGLDTIDRPDACLIFTFCGVPTLSVPMFTGPTDLPFGLQLVAKRYNDYLLLAFARELCQEA